MGYAHKYLRTDSEIIVCASIYRVKGLFAIFPRFVSLQMRPSVPLIQLRFIQIQIQAGLLLDTLYTKDDHESILIILSNS